MDQHRTVIRRRRRGMRPWAVILLCILCALIAAAATLFYIYGQFGGRKEFRDAQRYLEVQNAVTKNYIGDYKASDLKNAAANAMIDSLGDRWSYYMTADEYKSYKLHSANQYEGIGVTIDKDEETGGFRIRSVMDNTPASSAKLQEGQIIIAVDDEDVTDLTVDGIRELISSKIDSKINLVVLDDGDKVTYKLDCSVIYSNPVSYELTNELVGYIRIANFDAGSGDATISAIDNLVAQGATSLIFDVRDNPGGMLSELIKVMDYVLPSGEIFVSVDSSGKETVKKSDNVCLQMVMSVLVNENSFSAAEYFAAALQEYEWATVVGAPTTGKARSQTTIELSDGSAVHISNHKYLTPKRVDLSDSKGINPDVVVNDSAMDPDGLLRSDKAVQAAIDAMNGYTSSDSSDSSDSSEEQESEEEEEPSA